ncbi:MAG: glycine cleavage system aminomethyltransferase GcvT [Chloroflexi bacterium]|nr:glycine cleavage system aminomethyltransferase GcvT [Chloroflexota bacterium]
MTGAPLLQTALHETHVRLGARMVGFAGYDMPVQYEGILAEARAVRTGAGVFDVSHMGRILVEGAEARALLDWVHTADIGEAMPLGRARYGLVCNEDGGIIDDGIVYRLADERFMLIANAANAATVFAWLERWRAERFAGARLENVTADVAMLAVQGPEAIGIVAAISDFDPSSVRPFRIAECSIEGRRAWVARTGYTGEDGVELMPSSADAAWLWELLLERGVVPCGLGARDTLRLEAGLLLHGSDMDAATNPIEAGLGRFVALDAGDFCGAGPVREAARRAAAGDGRRLAAFEMTERGALPRPHAPLLADGAVVGQVSSGGYAPTLDRNIGLGYVPAGLAAPQQRLQVDVRGNLLDATVVALPFYSRPRP